MPVSVVEIRGDTGPLEDALSKLPAEGRAAARGMAKKMLGEMEDLDKALDPLTDAIKSARGVSNREAKRMARGIIRANARAASAVEKEYERSFSGQFSAIKGLSSAVFGGVAGDAFDAAEAIQGADGQMAALGLTLGGLAIGGVAIVGLVEGMRALTEAAIESRERLTEAGLAFAIDPAHAAALDAYTDTMDRLNTAADLATVKMGAELAPAMTRAEESIAGLKFAAAGAAGDAATLTDRALDAAEAFVQWNMAIGPVVRVMQSLVSAEAEESAAASETARATLAAAEAVRQREDLTWNMISDGFVPMLTKEDEARIRAENTAAAHDLAAAAARRRKKDQYDLAQSSAAVAEIDREISAEFDEMFKGQGEINRETGEWLASLEDARRSAEGLRIQMENMPPHILTARQIAEGLTAHLERGFAAIDALGQQAIGTMGNVAELQQIKIQEAVDKRRKSDQRAAREDAKRRKEGIADLLAEGQITQAQADKELAYIDRRRDAELRAADKLTDAEARAARKSHRLAKAAEISQALMESGAAALSLIPFFAPLGPAAPLAAAGVVSPFLGTQLALIRSQKPPELAGGRVPGMSGDHEIVAIQRSEVVLNSRASAALGDDAAQRLNDTGRTGDDAPIVAVFEVNGRELLQLTGRRRRTGHVRTQRI